MDEATWAEAPAARAPTEAVATLDPPSSKSSFPAGEETAPELRTVADRVTGSDSTGAEGEAATAVTCRSGLGAGAPNTWNSAT